MEQKLSVDIFDGPRTRQRVSLPLYVTFTYTKIITKKHQQPIHRYITRFLYTTDVCDVMHIVAYHNYCADAELA